MPNSLPLVHLSVLRPLLNGLRERGVDPEHVLEGVGLTEGAIQDDEATVHVMVIHQFLEDCARAVGDPTFCADVGSRLDPHGWPMIREAFERAHSLADFLSIYVEGATRVASSVTTYLEIRGDMAIFGATRLFEPTIPPAQNDGFMISLALSILELGMGGSIDPDRVIVVVCDPAILPDRFRPFQVLRGDRMGSRIQFPSEWLSLALEPKERRPANHSRPPRAGARGILADIRRLLQQNIGKGGLDAKAVAELAAMSRWKLARLLSHEGTDISTEQARAKLEFARSRLRNSDQSIEEIASALGYSDPSNFARSFKRQSGQNPTGFRSQPRD